jgi:regulator of sigma E protease
MFGTVLDFLLVVFGFGAIIFVHELGHFLAARWAGIRVLAFAIGFGPALFSFRKGIGIRSGSSEREAHTKAAAGDTTISPTEYRLNALPFGGYVRMLGQEDGNPYAVSAASDSYQSCKPWKRMVVICAGVVMNIITAAILFVAVFMIGMKVDAPAVGSVVPGSPAATAAALNGPEHNITTPGLLPGDVILSIDGHTPNSFNDVTLATAMARRSSIMEWRIARPSLNNGNTPLDFLISPRQSDRTGMLEIGVEPSRSLAVIDGTTPQERAALAAEFTANGIQNITPGAKLVTVDGREATHTADLFLALRNSGGTPVTATFSSPDGNVLTETFKPRAQMQVGYVQRPGGALTPVDHLLGLTGVMAIAEGEESVSATARQQGLLPGDVFARINALEFPSMLAGMTEIQSNRGKKVSIAVLRRSSQGNWEEVSLPAVAVGRDGRIGLAIRDTSQMWAVVSLPLASMTDLKNEVKSTPPAAGVFSIPGMRIVSVNGESVSNFTDLRTALVSATAGMQATGAKVQIRYLRPVNGQPVESGAIEELTWNLQGTDISTLHALSWDAPISAGLFEPQQILLKSASPREALVMGLHETKRVMLTTYVTFARLFEGTVKIEHLKGPVGIAHLGTLVAGKGGIWLMFFLALISVNLAVVNFLPLPIVDGGQFLFVLWEQIRGRPVPLPVQNAATLAGLAFIGCMFLIVTFNDIKNLIGL